MKRLCRTLIVIAATAAWGCAPSDSTGNPTGTGGSGATAGTTEH